ncbi:alcohol acetyltransferase [Xylariomycetidae sp. FL2044]|nr:alcohol acetyltransferase [Xylariomycetidae sp. FL2044]
MRFASPNELRTISREDLGFYRTLTIGAVYEFSRSSIDIRSRSSFFGALKRCIDRHPTLSYAIKDKHTDAAFYERVPAINLEDHIIFAEESSHDASPDEKAQSNELRKIEKALPSILDHVWTSPLPPWRIVVLPLSPPDSLDTDRRRCYISFAYSHGIGDGINGLAFHRTFKEGLFDRVDKGNSTVATPVTPFPSPFDTPERLPISWGFLLAPFIAHLLPKFVAELFHLRATTSGVNADTWTGTRMFFNPESFHSNARLVEISAPVVEHVLRTARKNGAKLTATLSASIARALDSVVPSTAAKNLVAGIAVNMRRSAGISDAEMGFFTNSCYGFYDRNNDLTTSPLSEPAWASARSLTQKLAESAVNLEDQPIGLLRYVHGIRNWTAAKIGGKRDCSYELSNLGAFDTTGAEAPGDRGQQCSITKMVFARPSDAIGSPIGFSVVNVRGGIMVISISWQEGALGIPVESESAFVDRVSTFLEEDLKNLE